MRTYHLVQMTNYIGILKDDFRIVHVAKSSVGHIRCEEVVMCRSVNFLEKCENLYTRKVTSRT